MIDCPTCKWPIFRDDNGRVPFACPACGDPVPGNFDLVSTKTVNGVEFRTIRAKMSEDGPSKRRAGA